MVYHVHQTNKCRYKNSNGPDIVKKLNIGKILGKLSKRGIKVDTYPIGNSC